jgi:carbon monoxide dehydrogenase subunit G
MATTARESVVVRRPFDVVAKVATDPGVMLPLVAGLGRFDFIGRADDGTEEWDMFLDIGAIHVGGRVRVVSDPPTMTWRSVRGTRHSMRVEVTEHPHGAEVSMAMTVQLGGLVMGRLAERLARGIAGRHLVAGLEQLRHHLEFGRAE